MAIEGDKVRLCEKGSSLCSNPSYWNTCFMDNLQLVTEIDEFKPHSADITSIDIPTCNVNWKNLREQFEKESSYIKASTVAVTTKVTDGVNTVDEAVAGGEPMEKLENNSSVNETVTSVVPSMAVPEDKVVTNTGTPEVMEDEAITVVAVEVLNNDLPDDMQVLASQVNQLCKELEFHRRKGLAAMLSLGQALSKAKQKVPHGEWEDWVKDNCGFSDRMAQYYMKGAKQWNSLNEARKSEIISDLGKPTLTKLLKMIREANTKPSEEKPPSSSTSLPPGGKGANGETLLVVQNTQNLTEVDTSPKPSQKGLPAAGGTSALTEDDTLDQGQKGLDRLEAACKSLNQLLQDLLKLSVSDEQFDDLAHKLQIFEDSMRLYFASSLSS